MGDNRIANPDYAEDVDVMILEYLIYSATKCCLDDFMSRNESQTRVPPGPSVQVQLDILDDFLQILKAKYPGRKQDEEIQLWLELLDLMELVSRRSPDGVTAYNWGDVADRQPDGWRSGDPELAGRRQHWLSAREKTSKITGEEHDIYSAWSGFYNPSTPKPEGKLPPRHHHHHPLILNRITPLFFTISAKIASFIDQAISKQWVELGAEFMLQGAVESCMLREDIRGGENPLAPAFAWGWIPPTCWDDYESGDESGAEVERTINDLFEYSGPGNEARENRLWKEARLRYLSFFGSSSRMRQSEDDVRAMRLRKVVTDYPFHEFQRKVMVFSNGMWDLCRKPLLVQVEKGEVNRGDGSMMTEEELKQFRRRVFATC